jgi:hypothetical protein
MTGVVAVRREGGEGRPARHDAIEGATSAAMSTSPHPPPDPRAPPDLAVGQRAPPDPQAPPDLSVGR